MFHICRFNLVFLGLGFKLHSPRIENYGITTFELYKCNKCGKLVFINEDKLEYIFRSMYDDSLINIQKCGYRAIGELIKEDN